MAVRVNILTGYNGKGVTSAVRDLGRMEKAAKLAGANTAAGLLAASAGMQRAGAKMSEVGMAATTKLTLPLVAVGAYAFNTAAEFETSMNQVAAATNAPAADMAKLSELAKKMGADTIYSANDAGQAMLELAKSGMDPAEISAGGLQATMLLAAAGGVELASAATTTSNALNMFGMSADKADVVANALAGGANASSASVESLQQALSQVGPGARNAGLSLNDTVGVLAAFADKGIQGSDAGTSLKTMLTRLVPQTEAQGKAMEALGLSFVDNKGNFDDISTVAQKLHDKLGGLSEAERSRALTTLFGSDATRAATVLMQEGAAGIEKYIAATNDQAAAQAMADARMGGAAGAMEAMKGSVETAALALGQGLAPTVTQVAGVITRLANSFAGLSPGMQGMIVKAGLAAAAFGPVMLVLGKLTTGVGNVVGVAGKLTLAFSDGAEAAPRWAQAIASGVKGAASLAKQIAETVVSMARQASYTVMGIGLWIKDTAVKIANTAAAWANIAAQKAAAVGAQIWAAAQWLLNAAMTANPIGLVVVAIVALIAAFVLAWKNSETFRKIVTAAWNAVKNAAVALWQWVTKVFTAGVQALSAAWNAIKGAASAAWSWLVGMFKKYGIWILGALTGPIGLLAVFLAKNWDKIKSGAVTAWNALLSFIKAVPGKILGFFAGVGQWLLDIGSQLVQGLKNGITNAWASFKSWFSDLIGQPIQWAKNILGIASPSRVFRDIGHMTGQGLALGLEDKNGRVTDAARSLATATVQGMDDLPDKVRKIAAGVSTAEIKMLESRMSVADAERSLGDAIKEHGKKSDAARLATLRLAAARAEAKDSEKAYKDSVRDSKKQVAEFTEKANALLARKYNEATYRTGRDAAQGLANGINSGYGAVYKAVKKLAEQGIKGNLKKLLEVKSPSRVLMEIGVFAGEGLANGILAAEGTVTNAMGKLAAVVAGTAFAMNGPALAGAGAAAGGSGLDSMGSVSGSRGMIISVGGIRVEVNAGDGTTVEQARAVGTAAGEEAARAFMAKVVREMRAR